MGQRELVHGEKLAVISAGATAEQRKTLIRLGNGNISMGFRKLYEEWHKLKNYKAEEAK